MEGGLLDVEEEEEEKEEEKEEGGLLDTEGEEEEKEEGEGKDGKNVVTEEDGPVITAGSQQMQNRRTYSPERLVVLHSLPFSVIGCLQKMEFACLHPLI